MEENRYSHGGDIYRNKVDMDFSVNVNPLGMPDGVRGALIAAVDECEVYPDLESERLLKCTADYFGVGEDEVVLGNGASELFNAIINAIKPEKALLPAPTFSGYEYAASGVEIEYFYTNEADGFSLTEDYADMIKEDTDIVFICSPNNPTGKLVDLAVIEKVIEKCRLNDALVVLDESFAFFCEKDFSMLSRIDKYENLIIVNSFTKIFCIPGVRLGACFSGNRDLITKIRRAVPEWNVSVFAQRAGEACLKDRDFVKRTVEYVRKERQYLADGLRNKFPGIKIYESDVNYLLLYCDKPLYDLLLEKGILIRDCCNFNGLDRGYYRVAVRTHDENTRLMEAVSECVGDVTHL